MANQELMHGGNPSRRQQEMYLVMILDKLQTAFRVKLETSENAIWLEDLSCLLEEVGKTRLERGLSTLMRTWKREYGKTYFPLIGELRDCIPPTEFRGTYEKYEAPEETPDLQAAREQFKAKLEEVKQSWKMPEPFRSSGVPSSSELAETLSKNGHEKLLHKGPK